MSIFWFFDPISVMGKNFGCILSFTTLWSNIKIIGSHEITEILLKVALNTINLQNNWLRETWENAQTINCGQMTNMSITIYLETNKVVYQNTQLMHFSVQVKSHWPRWHPSFLYNFYILLNLFSSWILV